MSENFFDFDTTEFKAVNGLSIAGSGLTLLYSTWIHFKKPAYLDRVSLRIQTLIAFFDIIRHFVYLFNTSSDNNTCKMIAFLYFFCFHANTFLNVAIAFNLQRLYIQEKPTSTFFVSTLYLIPISASLVVDLVPFVLGVYGRDSLNSCFLVPESKYYEAMKMLLLYLTNYTGLIYCFFVPVIVMAKLWTTEPDSELGITAQSPLVRKMAFRISLYPLFCFICHLGSIVFNVNLSITNNVNQSLFNWLLLGLSINGIMNFICFILDPYILESLKKNSTIFFEPIKPEPEAPLPPPPASTSIDRDRNRFESEPPSEKDVPDLSTSDTSSLASRDVPTPHFLRTPVNSYSQSEPIHFLTDAATIEEDIVAQIEAEEFHQTQVPHDILRFY